MLDAAVKAALEDIKRVWDDTETVIKRAERIRGQVVEPAINELRYAGRRLVDAMAVSEAAGLDAEARKQFDSFVMDCLFRCYCAQHDAFDASILFVQRVIREYENEFGLALIHKQFPWLVDLKAKVFEADDLIVESRKDRGRRSEIYRALADDHLPTIVLDYRKLVSSRDALIALFIEYDKGTRKETRRFWSMLWITVGAAVLGAVVAAVLTVYLTLKYLPPFEVDNAAKPSAVGATPDAARPQKP